jgi:hypothetical protein
MSRYRVRRLNYSLRVASDTKLICVEVVQFSRAVFTVRCRVLRMDADGFRCIGSRKASARLKLRELQSPLRLNLLVY